MLSDGLVILVRFDEAGGPAQEFAQGRGDVLLQGGADRTAGQFGNALRLNAATDQAELQDGLSNIVDPVSISARVYITKLPSAMWGSTPRIIVAKGDGVTGGYALGNFSGDDIGFRVVDQAFSVYEAKFTVQAGDLNRWVSIIGVHERNNVYIYKDGVIQDTQLSDGFLYHDPSVLPVFGSNWEGLIDDAAVWNRSLTSGDIAEASSGPILLPPADTIDLDVGVGWNQWSQLPVACTAEPACAPDAVALLLSTFDTDTAEDTGGQNNHGTVTGATFANHNDGRAVVFANPSGLSDATQFVRYPDLGEVAAGENVLVQFAFRTSDAAQSNGRLFSSHAATDAFLTNSGIRISYNTDTRANLTAWVSDGTTQVVVGDEANAVGLVTDDAWHHLQLFLDRVQDRVLIFIDGDFYASAPMGTLGAVSLGDPVLGAHGVPAVSPPDAPTRGAIATVDQLTIIRYEAELQPTPLVPLVIAGYRTVSFFGLSYLDAPFLPTLVPTHPQPTWVDSSFDAATSRLIGEVTYQTIVGEVVIDRYWEVEIVENVAYMRVYEEYPVAATKDTVTIDFTPPENLSMGGLRARYVIESRDARELLWTTDWLQLEGGSGPGPGPGPEPGPGYPLLVTVNIFEFDDGTYRVDRTPDIYDALGAGVDYTWNRVEMKDEELGPLPVDKKAGSALVLEAMWPGRFRYRLTAQWPGGESYSQDYILLVRDQSDGSV